MPQPKLTHPEWSKNAAIYQLNTRQFTPEGTLRAAETHLPRLAELGVTIIWLMPIHPIGEKTRKGTLGSPYSVRDYYGVNPDLGTLADLKYFVQAAHHLGLYVILDWVANHTAWDNPLAVDHPEWYARDWKGDFRPTPWWDWPDIIDLDYDQPAVRNYMTEAMKYWAQEADIDGYRCDVAGFVPTDFWNHLRRELDAIKPVFMLAEWEDRDLHTAAFDMTYAWTWHQALRRLVNGEADLAPLFVYYSWNEKAYPRDCMRMLGVTNHDMNAWDGTEFEMFGDAVQAAIVLSFISEGMPMIYNGSEAGNNRRLAFFEKDPIEWKHHPHGDLFKRLLALKKTNTALWNGAWGARMVHIPNSVPTHVLSFVRADQENKVFAIFNFSDQEQTITFADGPHYGTYQEYLRGEPAQFHPDTHLTLGAWAYRVYIKETNKE